MGTAVLPVRRRPTIAGWRLAPTAIALVFGLLFLALEPRPGDLAVHVFRADLFGREGFTIWNGRLVRRPSHAGLQRPDPAAGLAAGRAPAAGGVLRGLRGAVRAVAVGHFGARRARWGAIWLGFGTVTLLATSRLPFALGTAFGLAGALALQRDRRGLALTFAVLSPLASPVAGLFTGMGGLAYGLSGRGRAGTGAALAVAALGPPVLLSAAFPEGGWAPFPLTAYLPIPILCAACLIVLPRRERALRVGAVLYALGATATVAAETPGEAPRRAWECCSAGRCCCAPRGIGCAGRRRRRSPSR